MAPSTPQMDAGTERLIEESLERRHRSLDIRERAGSGIFALAFFGVATTLALLGTAERAFDPLLALAFVVAFAAVARVEFSGGAGYAVPTQLVFVPMLLLLPTPYVPLLVAAALVLSSAWQALRGGAALGRSGLAVGDAWFSVGPAVVLVAAGAQLPSWAHWPVYLGALVAQLVVDGTMSTARVWVCQRIPPAAVLRDLHLVYRVDVLLSPLGLLTAIAAADAPLGWLLVLPLVSLLLIFSREREGRIAQTLELGRAYRGTALLLRDLIEEDDEYTGRHTEDVVELAVRVAERLGVDEDTRRATELGALLHDIGKIAIPDEVINKPGPLDEDEWKLMRTHTLEGERMLQRVGGLLASVGTVVRASHERWDGRGYPDGLVGEAIPLAARVVSASDAYSAMTTDRPYRSRAAGRGGARRAARQGRLAVRPGGRRRPDGGHRAADREPAVGAARVRRGVRAGRAAHRGGPAGPLSLGAGGAAGSAPASPETCHDLAVTSRPAAAQHLRDLARLRRVRDRIDREYAQPLDVEALARGAHMSAGHLSREFRLRLRRVAVRLPDDAAHRARDGAAAPWRPQRHRGLLRGRLLVAGHLQHPLHRAGRHAAQRLPAPGGERDGGDAAVRGEAGDQTDQESRSAGHRAATSVTAMDITIHQSFLPHDDPDASLAFYRDTLGFEVRNDVEYEGMHWITVGPADQPGTSIVLYPPAADPRRHRRRAPHHRRDDGQGHLRQHQPGHRRPRRHLRAAAGRRRRGRPGADRPAVRDSRLRLPRSRGQPDPHPGAALSRRAWPRGRTRSRLRCTLPTATT